MASACFLGVDTSNYTTSLAVVDDRLTVLANLKYPLPVKEGERGLRQSDALFAHTKQLPGAFAELRSLLAEYQPLAVGVSERPRNRDGSYMPCFLAGVSAAEAAAATRGVPLYRFSHQCGHLMAALVSVGHPELAEAPFAAYHLSGGTTELLLAEPGKSGFSCEIVGGTLDLSAGQLVDRIGVAMGLRFPAGAEMERLARSYTGKLPHRRPAVKGCRVNLSGAENLAAELYRATGDAAKTAAFVFSYLSDMLCDMTEQCFETYGRRPLVCAGGVMSCAALSHLMTERYGAYVAEPALSSDNAVGIAALAAEAYLRGAET